MTAVPVMIGVVILAVVVGYIMRKNEGYVADDSPEKTRPAVPATSSKPEDEDGPRGIFLTQTHLVYGAVVGVVVVVGAFYLIANTSTQSAEPSPTSPARDFGQDVYEACMFGSGDLAVLRMVANSNFSRPPQQFCQCMAYNMNIGRSQHDAGVHCMANG